MHKLKSLLVQVAGAMSEDKARQGGDLGWKSRVRVSPLPGMVLSESATVMEGDDRNSIW